MRSLTLGSTLYSVAASRRDGGLQKTLLTVVDKLAALDRANSARFEALSTAVEEATKSRAARMDKARALKQSPP